MRTLLIVASALVLAGCVTKIDVPPVRVGGIVDSMPKSHIGVAGHVRVRPARELIVPFDKTVARRAFDRGLTLALLFDDCTESEHFWVMDVFWQGVSLYQLHLSEDEFRALYESAPSVAEATSYIHEDTYREYQSICVYLRGGNMLGQIMQSPRYRIK